MAYIIFVNPAILHDAGMPLDACEAWQSARPVLTVGGALLGTSTVTSYVESAAGIAAGGRTGVTAVTTGVLFLLSTFALPLIGVIPASATAPVLVLVGMLMMAHAAESAGPNRNKRFPRS